jgi:EAL domain-containing protein (putative c-di-GMP-specific phosphodiesterase class I)
VPISAWVLKTACLEAAQWRKRYPADPPLYVSINISSKHFSHADLIAHVKDALEQSAVDPKCVTIELTESLAMKDVVATSQAMSLLRALGVKLSIDDFGTGYSSLSYLRRFPVNTLKIDQSFVKTMDAENYAIVTTIVGRNPCLRVGSVFSSRPTAEIPETLSPNAWHGRLLDSDTLKDESALTAYVSSGVSSREMKLQTSRYLSV